MAKTKTELREWISNGFTRVEEVAYVGLGLVLAVSALVLLVFVAISLGEAIISANLPVKIVRLLDQSLLILMIVEILYTLQVSFREHTLVAEPFLIVGLIAAIRRVLILTAEFSKPAEIGEAAFHNVMFELGLLTALILALVFSLSLMKRQHLASADRS
ncbi:MAG TPA: phosphate-starvation-inducible PsiE family protein [Candidatus Saccharimonadales bacterium]|nr:phosphate-starvation-inducible PsiE family protein [Candidatus Saccharimonadales bacterium]